MTGKPKQSTIHSEEDISKLGTIMGIWAHPDDETFSMAGIMAAAVKNGQKVICVTATKGEAGVQDETKWPAEKLAEIRDNELKNALSILGVGEHTWLGYSDGCCKDTQAEEAIDKLVNLIREYEPDSIFTFGPDGMTGHDDHKAVSAWAKQAAQNSGLPVIVYNAILTQAQYKEMLEVDKHFNIFFNIDRPDVCDGSDCEVCFCLDDELFNLKLKALAAMPSQTEGMVTMFGHGLRKAIGDEAFRLA